MDPSNDIRSLIVHQKLVGDDQDEAATRECWAREATLTIRVNNDEPRRMVGRDAVIAFTKEAWATDAHGSREAPHVHFGGPAAVRLLDDTHAQVRSTCLYVGPAEAGVVIHGFGRYQDDVIFEDGQWRLLNRRLHITQPGA